MGRIGNITVYTSIHSSGEKLIIPWGHSDQPYHNRDSLVQLLDTGRLVDISFKILIKYLPELPWDSMARGTLLEMSRKPSDR